MIGTMDAFPDVDRERLAELCRRFHVARLELFGSRAIGTARPESDVDLLVTFEEGKTPGLGFVALCLELESLFRRHVDLLTRRTVERDEDPDFRRGILDHAETLYAA